MIGIVILNYISFTDTKVLVEKLQNQTVANGISIVVVDNFSPNNSFEHLKPLEEQFLNLKVLQTEANLGYAKGNNCGLKYLDENVNPNYAVILNNDVVLPKDSIEKLIKKYKELERPAIIAPKQLDIEGKEMLPNKLNTFLDDCLSLFYVFKLFNKGSALEYKDTSGQEAMVVDMIPGSYMFTEFNTFKKMGFFYPNTFLFAEERFLAVKAKELNLHNYIVLDSTYIHAHSKTINTVFSPVSKYKMLYKEWLGFTRVCRSNGKLKVAILKPLMVLSLWEMKIVNFIRILFHKK